MKKIILIIIFSVNILQLDAQTNHNSNIIFSSRTGDTIMVRNFEPKELNNYKSGWSILTNTNSKNYNTLLTSWIQSSDSLGNKTINKDSLKKYNCIETPVALKDTSINLIVTESKTKHKGKLSKNSNVYKHKTKLTIIVTQGVDTVFFRKNFKTMYLTKYKEIYLSKGNYSSWDNEIETEVFSDKFGNKFLVVWLAKLSIKRKKQSFTKEPRWIKLKNL